MLPTQLLPISSVWGKTSKPVRIARGEPPLIFGDGRQTMDFVHVADVATAVRLALDAAQPGTCRLYTVGSGVGTCMREVINGVANVSGRLVPVRQLPPKPEPHTLISDPAALRAELGWTPAHSLGEGLAETWRWMEER